MSVTDHLFSEFKVYYQAERCRWAPDDPKRVFNIGFASIYPEFADWMSPEHFLSIIYDTLGFRIENRDKTSPTRNEKPRMFASFDPAKYTGNRPVEDHFVSLFAKKLWGKAKRALSRTTDNGRAGDRDEFGVNPDLGLLSRTWVDPNADSSPSVSERTQNRLDAVPASLATLSDREMAVVHLAHWRDLPSDRRMAEELGLDHRTVGRARKSAMAKLTNYFQAEHVAAV